jgi:hypothetical protein
VSAGPARDVLPIPDPTFAGELPFDARDPNVLIVTLYLDGEQLAKGELAATVPPIFSGDETTDLGQDTPSPVAADCSGDESIFNGTVNWVQLDIDEAAEDLDHLISPEERLRVAMARQ